MRGFNTVLVANRGEIAVRIINTAKKMGYETVAVYSEADANSVHVKQADKAICIGESPANQSYLDIEKILAAAKETGAEVIHPGYGFLSESTDFVEACEQAGFIFVGPPASAVALMASKTVARHEMAKVGVPLVPGYDGPSADDAVLQTEADRIGYPLMVKAAAGGGGRGIRIANNSAGLLDAVSSARAEALSTFRSAELLLEKCVVNARHIEVQVFADQAGNAVYLGDRDCSMQRRNQKVIEEAPAVNISDEVRKKMGEVAVQAAKAVAYVGAGTVEFLLEETGEFYFLEMNTRLQVEHPVTEMVTGEDLVEWQLRVAAGENLPKTQQQITLQGHAIEVRIYAEDFEAGFVPQTGTILSWQAPSGEGIRVDSGITSGQVVSPHYDSMVAKLICFANNRDESIRRLRRALRDSHLLGLSSNKTFLLQLIDEPVYIAGKATTRFIEEQFLPAHTESLEASDTVWALAAVLLSRTVGASGWRSTGTLRWPVRLSIQSEVRDFYVSQQAEVYTVENMPGVDEPRVVTELQILEENGVNIDVLLNGVRQRLAIALDQQQTAYIDTRFEAFSIEKLSFSDKTDNLESERNLAAPMSGRISEIRAKAGDTVNKGDVLVVLESMKMFQELTAQASGVIAEVYISADDQVDVGAALIDLADEED